MLLAGNALVARRPSHKPERDHGLGLIPATGAAVLYGGGFWLQGAYVVVPIGSIVTVWSYYLLGTLVIGILVLRRVSAIRIPGAGDAALAVATDLFAVLAYLALTVGQRMGSVAIVTMLSSLASVFSVLVAVVLLKERIAPEGWAGVAGMLLGLVFLHA